jgi:hypothetical protein
MDGVHKMTSYVQIDGPLDINKITWLAEQAILTFIKDRFLMVIIHGPGRLGKSAYASLSCAETYAIIKLINNELEKEKKGLDEIKDKLELRKKRLKIFEQLRKDHIKITPDWDIVKKYFIFKPRDLIRISRIADEKSGKEPMVIQDDAGRWLNSKEHATRFVRSVTKNFEVIGSKWGTIVFTCKNLKQLVSLARNDPDIYTVHIMDHADEKGGGLLPQRRVATIYEGWESEDTRKSGRKWIDQNIFFAWMNDKFFAWYNPIRISLQEEGNKEMAVELKELESSNQYE